MGYSLLAGVLLVVSAAAALWIAQASRLRRLSLERVGVVMDDSSAMPEESAGGHVIHPYPTRYRLPAVVTGITIASVLIWTAGLPAQYFVGAGILAAVISYLLEMYWTDQRMLRIEAQLADAIDLMVATLRAGAALLASLETVLREAEAPLRPELETLIGRIRLGEDPRQAVQDLARRVPLETFRLFAHCLLVHWETGGSLASSLRTVGRTVRDRLEVTRRINAQAVESQISVAAVMAINYGLMYLMLRSNPGPMLNLLYSQVGAYGSAVIMVLQATGMFWIWTMSRIRF